MALFQLCIRLSGRSGRTDLQAKGSGWQRPFTVTRLALAGFASLHRAETGFTSPMVRFGYPLRDSPLVTTTPFPPPAGHRAIPVVEANARKVAFDFTAQYNGRMLSAAKRNWEPNNQAMHRSGGGRVFSKSRRPPPPGDGKRYPTERSDPIPLPILEETL